MVPHFSDSHIDHQISFKASLVALRPNKKLKIEKILAYETLSETEWGNNIDHSNFVPNYFIKLNKSNIDSKIKSFKMIKSQNKPAPHPRSAKIIKSLAILRGSTILCEYSESFVLIRNIK